MRLIITAIIFFTSSVYAQTAPSIRTGRPGQSINPYTVGDKILQLQTGYQLDENQIDTSTINNTTRYGLGEYFEVNLNFDLKSDNANNKGLDNTQVGVRKSFLSNANGWLTDFASQLRMRMKGHGDFEKSRHSFILTNAFAFKAIGDFSYGININFQTNGEDTYIEKFFTLGLSYSLTDQLGIFFEPYLLKARETSTLSVNTGASYTISKNLACDFSFGQDVSDGDNRFLSFGFSIRR